MVIETSNGVGLTKCSYQIALHLQEFSFEMVMFNVTLRCGVDRHHKGLF